MPDPTIVLASASPRRRRLLEQINLSFVIQPSEVEETLHPGTPPEQLAMQLADQKATEVSTGFARALIIGADTVVVWRDQILGKPTDAGEAEHMLARLSNTHHEVYTGVALLLTDEEGGITGRTLFHERTEVRFADLTPDEIREYVATGSPMDKAGAYGIQDDWGSLFVSEIRGDYYNVVGFPLQHFYRELKSFAPAYLPRAVSADA